MGYSEIACQLCGVSFAIARLRRADEPPEAAWDYTGEGYVEWMEDEFNPCWESPGCEKLKHTSSEGEKLILEHIPGPDCKCTSGYSGHRISLEEMKGCRAIQALIPKGPDWSPEPDDQEFELESNYFLTGIGDGSPDESPLEDIRPVRHGIDEVLVGNLHWSYEDDNDEGLPIHPTCFEIFKRVSQLQLGYVDVEGLWFWRKLEGVYEEFFDRFPREPGVRDGSAQFWWHVPGFEYLAANPVEIPGLPSLLELPAYISRVVFGAKYADAEKPRDRHDAGLPTSTATDPFQKLSAELNTIIIAYLSSKDIANLRLAAPAFRQLPNILFKRLLLEDMPWFWEAQELNVSNTDWHHLYRKVKFDLVNLKGMRNRKRIWKDVEEILRRVKTYRSQGKLDTAMWKRLKGNKTVGAF